MDNKLQSGGGLIGIGSFGCVFKPALKCKNKKSVNDNHVSKILFGSNSKYETKEELKINKIIKSIKGYENWAYIWDTYCLPNEYSKIIKEEPEIDDCLNENTLTVQEFNNNRHMLIGNDAGITFNVYMSNNFKSEIYNNKNKFIKNFLELMKKMKPLFIGLVEMNNEKISHNDIKYDNIMIDEEGCKYIDFGLSAKYSNTKFFKQRSMTEFIADRIYPPYPLEFIYLYASKQLLEEELDYIKDDITRSLYNRYKLIHETIFKRKNIKGYFINLINYTIEGKLIKEKNNIITLLDTYSIGILVPSMITNLAKSYNKLSQLNKLLMVKEIKPFIELFKSMSEPDNKERLKPLDAYQRYLELESTYLKSNKKRTIKKRTIKRKRVTK